VGHLLFIPFVLVVERFNSCCTTFLFLQLVVSVEVVVFTQGSRPTLLVFFEGPNPHPYFLRLGKGEVGAPLCLNPHAQMVSHNVGGVLLGGFVSTLRLRVDVLVGFRILALGKHTERMICQEIACGNC